MIRSLRRFYCISYFSFFLGIALLLPDREATVIAERQRLPQDSGIAGLEQMLRKLQTTARLIHTTAHPDDEDSGMLTLESRGVGASVLLLTLNRGEGGQNKTGSELFDALGVLRTLELQAADDDYGVEQRFTRVVDFGFSKSADETFNKWQGREVALGDMVRVIRTFRPDVLVSRFQGTPRDGHGNHQASGYLTLDAFKYAGDPNRFPEQIKEGLQPWQPKKLYVDTVRANEEYTLRLNTGFYDPALGESYAQLALEGLSHQLSQGAGGNRAGDGPRYTYYKLVDSVLPHRPAPGMREQNFFDGIDTTLPGLASRLENEEPQVPFLRKALQELEHNVNEATNAFVPNDPSRAASSLMTGLNAVTQLISQIENSTLSPAAKIELLTHLRTKQRQFERAANLATAVSLEVFVDPAGGRPGEAGEFTPPQQTLQIAIPGQTFRLTAQLNNRRPQKISADQIQLNVPTGWKVSSVERNLKTLEPGESAFERFEVTVPADASYTRPYWHRQNVQTETIYRWDAPPYFTLPFPPCPVQARAIYTLNGKTGGITSGAQVKSIDPMYGQEQRPLAVGPPLSVELQPETQVIATNREVSGEVAVGVRSHVMGGAKAELKLELPKGWRVEPAAQPLIFDHEGEVSNLKFKVTPDTLKEGRYEVRAVAEYQGKSYAEGFTLVSRRDLGSFYFYRPAVQRVSVVDVKVPEQIKVGYIPGAGDEIQAVLQQVGVDVERIGPSELAAGDLSRFKTIVLGIRAYDVRSDVGENNKRLLDFVSNGGTLVVQYNQNIDAFNAGHFTPYPTAASLDRVTVEEAPVEILSPRDEVFQTPNPVTSSDFEGWVQERGLYFWNKWDDHFQPLLSSHDPGEQGLKGGLLRAQYGKGTYIFTGYAFFRQLPAGVPGAIRLFVNLISAGHNGK